MPEILDDSFAEKHGIINELFIATADDNYVLARWCFHQHLNVDFFWLTVHALENYLKAVLLLNGKSAKSYSYDIVKLYASVTPLAPELLPAILVKPEDRMPDPYWHVENAADFIARLHRDGQADNRYQLFGYPTLKNADRRDRERAPEDQSEVERGIVALQAARRDSSSISVGRSPAALRRKRASAAFRESRSSA